MLVLFETAAGFALFKVLKEKKLKKVESLADEFSTLEKATKLIKLKAFEKFNDSKSALKAVSQLLESKLSKSLKNFLKSNIISKGITDQLLVLDKKLCRVIEEKLGIKCLQGSQYLELIRGIRTQIEGLISGYSESEQKAMSLGLAHSLCRYTLKFSVDKIDTMIVQAVSLLDDIDKELNNYAMRLREWYSWHFPELARIITDNIVYAKCVKIIGHRDQCKNSDLNDVVPSEIEIEIKEAAELSMGTEITVEDMNHIASLCDQVVSLSEYRVSLAEYLKNRMQAIAPNLTVLVGELVGARLIAHAGSLVNLSKHPASTIQILGAEKALFRAIRTGHDTPKYGLLYHASIVGSATPNIKGKISRTLAAKCALCIRMDALGEETEATIGVEHKQALENRVKYLETHLTPSAFSGKRPQPYSKPAANPTYNTSTDATSKIELPTKKPHNEPEEKPKKKKNTDR
jgi:nucleolar protein 58